MSVLGHFSPEACPGGDVPGPPCISALGVSDQQHFGKRPDSSELSFLPGALYASHLRGLPLEPFLPGWGLCPGGGRACIGPEKVSSEYLHRDFSGKGRVFSLFLVL